MKQAVEYVRGLRYKIRVVLIPCEDPTFVYGNRQSMLANTSVPASTLNKKYNSIAFNLIQEGFVHDDCRTTYVNTHKKHTYLLISPLPLGEKSWRFVRRSLFLTLTQEKGVCVCVCVCVQHMSYWI